MSNINSKPDRTLAPMLASSFVVLGGLVSSMAMVAIFSRQPALHMAIIGGIMSLLVVVLWCLRDRPQSTAREQLSWVFSRSARPKAVSYKPRVIRDVPPIAFGTQRPMTAEEVHELKGTERNWVPSRAGVRRRPPRRQ